MSKQKYYVVWVGHERGIFTSWEACKAKVNGFKGAKYKAFKSRAMAEEAFQAHYFNYIGSKSSGISPECWPPNIYGLAVDAACSGNPGRLEYRGVDLKTRDQIFIQGPFEAGTNNIGEFLALVHALVLFKDQDMPIYSDSRTAIAWLKNKKVKTTLKSRPANLKLFETISRAENWLAKNTFTNPIFKWETKHWGEIPADFGRK